MRWLPRLLVGLLPLATACSPSPTSPLAAPDVVIPPAPPALTAEPAVVPVPAPSGPCARSVARALDTLRVPIEITVWVSSEPRLVTFAHAVDEALARYERLAPGKLQHRMVEVETDEQRAMAKADGIREGVAGAGNNGILGVSLKYGSEKDALPVILPDPVGVAYLVAQKIREVRDRADDGRRRIGLLTGVDEIKIGDANLIPSVPGSVGPNLRGVLAASLPYVRFEDVDVSGGPGGINDELVGLVITQPGRDLTDAELRRVDEFLLRGRSVVVFAGAVNMAPSDARMRATLHTHGIERLLAGYGVELQQDLVLDWARPATLELQSKGGLVKVSSPAIARVQFDPHADAHSQPLDQTFAAFFRLEEIPFPFASSLLVHPERQPGAEMRVLARTSPQSTVTTRAVLDLHPAHGPRAEGAAASRIVAVSVEGKLRSAFPGPASGAGTEPRPTSHLLVVASPQFLANPWARAGNPPPRPPHAPPGPPGDARLLAMAGPYAHGYLLESIVAFKETLDWMTSDDDLLSCSAVVLGR